MDVDELMKLRDAEAKKSQKVLSDLDEAIRQRGGTVPPNGNGESEEMKAQCDGPRRVEGSRHVEELLSAGRSGLDVGRHSEPRPIEGGEPIVIGDRDIYEMLPEIEAHV